MPLEQRGEGREAGGSRQTSEERQGRRQESDFSLAPPPCPVKAHTVARDKGNYRAERNQCSLQDPGKVSQRRWLLKFHPLDTGGSRGHPKQGNSVCKSVVV